MVAVVVTSLPRRLTRRRAIDGNATASTGSVMGARGSRRAHTPRSAVTVTKQRRQHAGGEQSRRRGADISVEIHVHDAEWRGCVCKKVLPGSGASYASTADDGTARAGIAASRRCGRQQVDNDVSFVDKVSRRPSTRTRTSTSTSTGSGSG